MFSTLLGSVKREVRLKNANGDGEVVFLTMSAVDHDLPEQGHFAIMFAFRLSYKFYNGLDAWTVFIVHWSTLRSSQQIVVTSGKDKITRIGIIRVTDILARLSNKLRKINVGNKNNVILL